ncbi:hypothetical protein Sya03_17510 [Spirilliplanes yamanashiensis]|uniref:Uncharacterized protein n=1 Tax=Spirilliplanes yamanashiensis TaxID=42233 RepID=A0A8J4DII2_9ACTN|nr:hypothetical protein Sya03_17510 [Spirilliplanes yamanashiensis]
MLTSNGASMATRSTGMVSIHARSGRHRLPVVDSRYGSTTVLATTCRPSALRRGPGTTAGGADPFACCMVLPPWSSGDTPSGRNLAAW